MGLSSTGGSIFFAERAEWIFNFMWCDSIRREFEPPLKRNGGGMKKRGGIKKRSATALKQRDELGGVWIAQSG